MWGPVGVMQIEALDCEHHCGSGGCVRGSACDWSSGVHHSQKKEPTVCNGRGESTLRPRQRASEGRG